MSSLSDLTKLRQRKRLPGELPGAVVIGGDYQGLGIVRSLGWRGVPICVLDDEHSISRFSRYATFGVRVPDLRNGDSVVDTLFELGRRLDLQGWVIFPTRDELVASISRHKAALSEFYRVPTPDWNTVQWMWDKRSTYHLAKELNIPIPKTWFPASTDDLEKIETAFPLALKPAIKEHFFYATKAKAWRAENPKELCELYKRASAIAGDGEIIVQDVIPGDGGHQFAYCAFFKDGKALGSMVTRRWRQHPHEFGRASTYVETIDMPALESLSQRFLQAINYYGLVEIEFKLDPRDGQFKLLDVNPRTWGYNSLGPQAGVDFPRLLYEDQLGESVAPCRGKAGVSWIRLLTDLPTGINDVLRKRLTWRAYAQSLRDCDTDAVFNRKDPLPAIAECLLLPYLLLKRGF
jgi:D-aspartate ligase